MGTSKAYAAPTSGAWPAFKRQVTAFVNEGTGSGNIMSSGPGFELLRRYVQVLGGAAALAGVGAAAGEAFARSATRTATSVGSFGGRVESVGLDQALRELNLDDLIGSNAETLGPALCERLAEIPNGLDESICLLALLELQTELLADAQTYEDVEQIVRSELGPHQVSRFVMKFYGYYLFERFRQEFYEDLVRVVGPDRASQSIAEIKEVIFSALEAKLGIADPLKFQWQEPRGQEIAQEILYETLLIFERPGS